MLNPKLIADEIENINQNANNISTNAQNIAKIGKKLWTGSFTSGSITVNGLSNYTAVAVMIGNVMCFGTPHYGIGGFGEYGSYAINRMAYRLEYNAQSEKLSITNNTKGGTNGSSQQAITAIYGLF